MDSFLYLPPWGMRAAALVGIALLAIATVRLMSERKRVSLRRQLLPCALRVAMILMFLFILMNPTTLTAEKIDGKSRLIVLIDTSGSMAVPDADGRPRLEAALNQLKAGGTLGALEDGFDLDIRRFDKDSGAAVIKDMTADAAVGTSSDIGSAICEAVSDVAECASQAGVIVVSDGRATVSGIDDAARLALARSVPLWTWCLGGEIPRRDLRIEVPSREVLAFAGSDVDLSAVLRQTGYPNRSFRVEVIDSGNVIDSIDVLPDATGEARVRTKIKAPSAGERRIVFRVVPDRDEADVQNNARAVFVRVVGEKVRVLLAEGRPHWDTKFLVQSLKRSKYVDLTAVYRLGTKRVFAVVSGGGSETREEKDLFPRSADDMAKYDVIVFGRGCEAFFDDNTEEYLTDFVSRRGGGLVFARGRPCEGSFWALSKFEPLAWRDGLALDVRLQPTRAGRESPVFELGVADGIDDVIERLPALDQVRATSGEKPLAVVLATAGAGDVTMAYHRYGQGKVLQMNASGFWRWAFRERGKDEDEAVYDRFWSGVLRWMLAGSDFLPGADVALRSDRRYYTDEQKMSFLVSTRSIDTQAYRPRLTVRGDGTDAEGQAPSGVRPALTGVAEIEPRRERGGGYVAEAGPFAPGSYSVVLHGNIGRPTETEMTVEVVSASIEKRTLSADPEAMAAVAEVSGGRVLSGSDIADMPGIVDRWRAKRQKAMTKQSMWDRWWLLGLLMAVMGVEWFARRQEGLL